MGYDLYFNRKDAEKVGVKITKVDTISVDKSHINGDGFWVEEAPCLVDVHEVKIDGRPVHTTNLMVCGDEISWRSSSFSNPEENGGEYDNEPTHLIKEKIPFTESY